MREGAHRNHILPRGSWEWVLWSTVEYLQRVKKKQVIQSKNLGGETWTELTQEGWWAITLGDTRFAGVYKYLYAKKGKLFRNISVDMWKGGFRLNIWG